MHEYIAYAAFEELWCPIPSVMWIAIPKSSIDTLITSEKWLKSAAKWTKTQTH